MPKKRSRILLGTSGLLAIIGGARARAATTNDTFNGAYASDPLNFQQPGNWGLNAVPVKGNTAVFSTVPASNSTVDVNGNATLDGLSFSATNAFTLGNSQNGVLTLDANGNNVLTTSATQANLITVSTNLQLAPVTPVAGLVLTAAISATTLNALVMNITGNISDSTSTGATTIGTGIVKTGNANLELSGSNSYTGGTVVQGGVIVANSNNAVGTGVIQLGNASTAANANPNVVTNGAFTVSANVVVPNLSAAVYTPGLGGSATQTVSSLFSGGITLNKSMNLRSYTTAGNAVTFSGTIASGTVAGTGITTTGSGTVVITGADTYSGPTNVGTDSLNGTLTVDSTNAPTASLGGTSAVTIGAGATLHLISSTANGTTTLVNDAATVAIVTNSKISLDLSNSVESIAGLSVNSTAQPAGIYGSAEYFGDNLSVYESPSALADVGYFSGDGAFFVPEPGSIGLIVIGSTMMLPRRKRVTSNPPQA